MNTIARVLVADDSLTIATALAISLRRAGFEVATTHSGEEALQIASDSRFDLVISDQQMLEMSGVDLCHQLRGTDVYRETPFFLLTASSELDANQLRELGVTHVLSKPFRPSEIVTLVRRFTETSPAT